MNYNDKIKAIIEVLHEMEPHLSDGYHYYPNILPPAGDKEADYMNKMVAIADKILGAVIEVSDYDKP